MTTLQIELPPKLIPIFEGEALYRCSHGGRGSAKTRSFAKMAAIRGAMWASAGISGQVLCAREFMNSLDDSSFAEIKAVILEDEWLSSVYDVGEKYIRTKPMLAGRIDFTFAGLRHNLDSVKSKSRIMLCWVDEAEPVSETAWDKLDNTIREEGSELWVTWNPERKGSPTDKRFRQDPPATAKVVQLNWRDNPWFHKTTLAAKRLEAKEKRPDSYEWIWEGAYATTHEGAYYAKLLAQAGRDGRIVDALPIDPVLPIYAFHDIGGAGAKADNYSIFFVQFVGGFANVLDHYTAQGQVLSYHIAHVRQAWPRSIQILPHDGVNHDKVVGKTVADHWRDGGFDVPDPVPNQGKGAAMQRVEATRRILPNCRFVRDKTESGRLALGFYHEKRDENRDIGLGPDHDWSSHDADAFGLMAIKFDDLAVKKNTAEDTLAALNRGRSRRRGVYT